MGPCPCHQNSRNTVDDPNKSSFSELLDRVALCCMTHCIHTEYDFTNRAISTNSMNWMFPLYPDTPADNTRTSINCKSPISLSRCENREEKEDNYELDKRHQSFFLRSKEHACQPSHVLG